MIKTIEPNRKGAQIHVTLYIFELTSLDFCQDHSSIKVADGNIPGHLINAEVTEKLKIANCIKCAIKSSIIIWVKDCT